MKYERQKDEKYTHNYVLIVQNNNEDSIEQPYIINEDKNKITTLICQK